MEWLAGTASPREETKQHRVPLLNRMCDWKATKSVSFVITADGGDECDRPISDSSACEVLGARV
jgi:hypothetical protein